MGASRAGYRSAELVAERVVMPAETLAELEAEAAETWRRVRAWCEARGVRVVSVSGGGDHR
jgi:hypothetical protein